MNSSAKKREKRRKSNGSEVDATVSFSTFSHLEVDKEKISIDANGFFD